MSVILTMHYPKSGIIQSQEFPTLHIATEIAHAHFAAFPDGYAQITDPDSQKVLMANEELRGTYDMARRREETPEAPPRREDTVSGFFSRLFAASPEEQTS